MRFDRLLALSLAAALALPATLLLPATALAEAADGAWNCALDDGSDFGALGFEGTRYIFANPGGGSGGGAIAWQEGADAPTFVILNGPLVSEVGGLGGWVDASLPEEPSIMLVDAIGNVILCNPRG